MLLLPFFCLVACNDHPIDTSTGAIIAAPTISNNQVLVTATSGGGAEATIQWTAATSNNGDSTLHYTVYVSANADNTLDISDFEGIVDATTLSAALSSQSPIIQKVTSGDNITSANVSLAVRGGAPTAAVYLVAVSDTSGNVSMYYPKGHMIVQNNLVYFFPFNPASSSSVSIEDIGPNNLTLTAPNGYLASSNRYGFPDSAVALNEGDRTNEQYLESDSSTDLQSTLAGDHAKAFSLWMSNNVGVLNGYQTTVFAMGYGASSSSSSSVEDGIFGANFQSGSRGLPGGYLHFWGYGTSYDLVSGLTEDTNSTWDHWVVSYDGTSVSMYKNGVLTSDGAQAVALNTIVSAAAGARLDICGAPSTIADVNLRLPAFISDVMVFDDALTQSEVTGLYNATKPIVCGFPPTCGLHAQVR